LFTATRFDWKYLTSKDPPHWTDADHNELKSFDQISVPENYHVFVDWKFECLPLTTDRRGWIYKSNFEVTKTTSTRTNESEVRYRKWERILVERNQYEVAKLRLSQFAKHQSQFRSLCPSLLKAALRKFNFHFQFVMECERLNRYDFSFSSSALIPGDPPQWSIGPELNLTNDPRLFPIYELQNAKSSLWSLIDGWEALHNFVPILYPNKDTEGWEYNLDFQDTQQQGSSSPLPWVSYPHIGTEIRVRRRIWMRTCIKSEWLYKCRSVLTEYINFHPRGVCYMSPVEIYLHSSTSAATSTAEEGEWHRCIGILRDQIFELKFIDSKNKRLKYSLRRTEVKDLPNQIKSGGGHSSSSSHSNVNSYRFILTKKGSTGNDLGTVCILRTLTLHEKQSWITQFVSQLDLLHICSNYPLHSFGPPVSDKVVIEGHMWKRGHVLPTWKYRFFRLRESGALTYYHNELLKGRIQLKHCVILDTNSNDFNSSQCSFLIQKNGTTAAVIGGGGGGGGGGGTYELLLKTTDRKTKLQWMTGISLFCGNQPTTAIKKIRFPSKGPLYSYENIYQESQGIFVKKLQQVDLRDEIVSNSSRSNSMSLDEQSISDTSVSSYSGSLTESLETISIGTNSGAGLSSSRPLRLKSALKSALKVSPTTTTAGVGAAGVGATGSTTRAPTAMNLPYREENIRYFSSLKERQSQSQSLDETKPEGKGKREGGGEGGEGVFNEVQKVKEFLLPGAEDDDDDDELDPSFYGLEEEDHHDNSDSGDEAADLKHDQGAEWEDNDDMDDDMEKEATDLDRKSSFCVVSNIKEYLVNHQDSAALMELMGVQEDP
jgi:hypothetical protein